MLYSPGDIPEEPDWKFWLYLDGAAAVAVRHYYDECEQAYEVSEDWSINWTSHLYQPPPGWYGPFRFWDEHEWHTKDIPRGIKVVTCPECDSVLEASVASDPSRYL